MEEEEDDNGDGFWWLQEIELARVKKERVDGERLKVVVVAYWNRLRNVKGLREGGEEDDRSLSMLLSIYLTANKKTQT
jgi:hypothetical protein